MVIHPMPWESKMGMVNLLWIDDVSQKLSFDHGTFFNPYHIPILIPILWPWSLHLSLKNIPRSVKSPMFDHLGSVKSVKSPDLVLEFINQVGFSVNVVPQGPPKSKGFFSRIFPIQWPFGVLIFRQSHFLVGYLGLIYGYYMVIIWLLYG